MRFLRYWGAATILSLSLGCADSDDNAAAAKVQLKNDFNNAEMAYQPPWTICQSSYLGVSFGTIALGATSVTKDVKPGLDYVLMVAAWNDPACNPDNALPLASKNEEEVVDGLSRTIALNMTNHQGPCPPEGTAPIPEETYNRILSLWPDYGFLPYASRAENQQCLADE
jgi:hypothetical protein